MQRTRPADEADRTTVWSRRRVVLAGIVVVMLLVAALAFAAGRTADGGSGSGSGTASSLAGGAAPAGPGADAARGSGPAAVAPEAGSAGGVAVGEVGRQLVRTAQLTLTADDPAAVSRRVRTAVATAGGTVSEEDSTDGGSRLALRVPAAKLDALMDDVAAFGHVTNRSSQTVDATEQVVDLDARVASQRASVERVRALLGQARSIGDVVAVESELTRREADLDSLTNRLTALRDQVALSTLTVDVERGPVPAPGGPGGFLSGLAGGWDGLLVLGAAVGTAAGFVLPFLPVLAVLAGLAWAGRRLVGRRRGAGRSGPAAEGGS